MEKELCDDPSNFIEVLDEVMLENPSSWKKHYHGTEKELYLKRKYSYSDRARYYIPNKKVQTAIHKLMDNLNKVEIPLNMLSQYRKAKQGIIDLNPAALAKDYIKLYYEDYHFATHIDQLGKEE